MNCVVKKVSSRELSNQVWRNPLFFLAFGFGSGLMPIGPGTFGTLAALPLYYLLASKGGAVYLIGTLIAFGGGIWLCDKVSQALGTHDFPGIVWDEIVGYLCTMFMVPLHLFWMVVGFFLFRVFDIWKPFPICWIDKKIPGGIGIMLDDVLAAVPAWLILQCLLWGWGE